MMSPPFIKLVGSTGAEVVSIGVERIFLVDTDGPALIERADRWRAS